MEGFLEQHDAKVKEILKPFFDFPCPTISIETDLWEAPNKEHWMAILAHLTTEDWRAITLLLYMGKLGVEHTAQNQADRIISVFRKKFDVDVAKVVWSISSDNTGSAANIATLLNIRALRCGAHVIALAPKHQFYEVERTVAGQTKLQMHENAVPECFETVQRVRDIHFRLRKEIPRKHLRAVQKGEGRPELQPIGDSSSKWRSILSMLERHWELRHDIAELAIRHPQHLVKAGGPLSADEMARARHIHAVMKSFGHATSAMDSDSKCFFAASAYLPVMKTLKWCLSVEQPVRALGSGANIKDKVKLSDEQLDPASRKLRAQLRKEMDTNWRHVVPCEGLLRLCTTMDPRYKLSLWDAEIRTSMKKVILELIADYANLLPNHAGAADEQIAPPAAKRGRTLQKRDYVADFQDDMKEALGTSSSSALGQPVDMKAKIRKQFKWYTDSPCIDETADPYAWWASQDPQYCSLLIPLARRLLTVPASNGDVERFFFTGEEVVRSLAHVNGSCHCRAGIAFGISYANFGLGSQCQIQ